MNNEFQAAEQLLNATQEHLKYTCLCKYFARGECENGNDCYFIHPNDRQLQKIKQLQASQSETTTRKFSGLCTYFIRGTCVKRENCSYLHPRPEQYTAVKKHFNRACPAEGSSCPYGPEYCFFLHNESACTPVTTGSKKGLQGQSTSISFQAPKNIIKINQPKRTWADPTHTNNGTNTTIPTSMVYMKPSSNPAVQIERSPSNSSQPGLHGLNSPMIRRPLNDFPSLPSANRVNSNRRISPNRNNIQPIAPPRKGLQPIGTPPARSTPSNRDEPISSPVRRFIGDGNGRRDCIPISLDPLSSLGLTPSSSKKNFDVFAEESFDNWSTGDKSGWGNYAGLEKRMSGTYDKYLSEIVEDNNKNRSMEKLNNKNRSMEIQRSVEKSDSDEFSTSNTNNKDSENSSRGSTILSEKTQDDVVSWTTDHVKIWWIENLPKACQQYLSEVVEDNELDGEELLDLTDKELEELGVKTTHRKKILKKIQKLGEEK